MEHLGKKTIPTYTFSMNGIQLNIIQAWTLGNMQERQELWWQPRAALKSKIQRNPVKGHQADPCSLEMRAQTASEQPQEQKPHATFCQREQFIFPLLPCALFNKGWRQLCPPRTPLGWNSRVTAYYWGALPFTVIAFLYPFHFT